MKTRPESRARQQVRRLSILLFVVAVVAAMAGCVAIQYTLTLSSTVGGSVTEPGEGVFTYNFCTEVSLVATPDSGYRFVNWTGDVQAVEDVNSPITIITSMNANYVIVANFEQLPPGQYSLTASSTSGGSVTTPGEGMFLYQEGTVVNLVATADTGYRFVSWTGDVGTIDNVDLPLTTIVMDGSYVIVANFEQIPPGQYSLTALSTSGGSVTTPGEGTFLYEEGTVVNLVATPDTGYRFVNWTGDVDTIDNVDLPLTTLVMDGSYVIRASFEQIPAGQFSLTASSTIGGSVTTPGEGTFLYEEGTVVNLVATPDTGYLFVKWTGHVDTIDNVDLPLTTIVMDGNYMIVANFEQIPAGQFSLTASSTSGGSVTTPGEGTFLYEEGTVVNLVATPDTGYLFVKWTGHVDTIDNVDLPLTKIVMDGNYVIVANFAQVPAGQYSLTASSTGGGSVTTPGEGTFLYEEGTVVNLVATADTGYRFVNWTGDVGTIANVDLPLTTLVMDGNYMIVANFAQIPAGQYSLTASSTGGGSVTTPGEGTFLYEEGTVVNLVATPDTGYRFVNWTGDVDTIANVNLRSTTITMDGDYMIRADFSPIPPDDEIPPGVVVGLTGHPVNKLAVMRPWIILGLGLLGGAGLSSLLRRRRVLSSRVCP